MKPPSPVPRPPFSKVMHLRSFLPLLVGLLLPLPAMATVYPNPLIPQRADPWIHLHTDGRYYFIATVPAFDRIELRAAGTIEGLARAEPTTIWTKHDSGPMSHHIWAPELHHLDGKWYVYFAAGRADAIWQIRMYVLENASPDPLRGEWIEKGRIETEWDTFSLDGTVFEHGGRRYYVWAQHEPGFEGNTGLYLAEMENPWTLRLPATRLTLPEFEWETQLYKVNEGAAVLKRNGRIFLAYSASGTDHNYCMGLLTASEDADLLDPASWTKSAEPVFRSSVAHGIYGPGHNSFTRASDGTDLLVYHARNYKELIGNPLTDPNRHTRVQPIHWREDGSPDFGEPLPETPPKVAAKPLYRDPVFDGAADPVVLWNPARARWWMFYTNRRASADGLSGVAWVHGTRIGIAESCDGGASWTYLGTAAIDLPPEVGGTEPTHWAPEVMTAPDGTHHMFLTAVPGVFEDWQHPRNLVHLTSRDLRHWEYRSTLALSADRVIDACVLRLDDGTWRMWYNNERDGKSIYYADSPDLHTWTDGGKVIGDRPGEGPKVFRWKGFYWMITDVWKGLGVYRSEDASSWTRQEGTNLLQHPGAGEDDGVIGGHADVVVQGGRAFLFYFTHPGRTARDLPDGHAVRRSSIQVTELHYAGGRLWADRDVPVQLRLDPRFAVPQD
jgi:GH43 family beta-xylosidase